MADLSFRAQIELIDRMTAPMRSISSQASRLSRQFGETSQAARKLQSQQHLINSFRQQEQALNGTSEAAQQSRMRLQQLQQQMSATANPSATLVRNFESASRESQRLNTRLDSQRQHLQQLQGRLETAGISTSNLANDELDLALNIRRTNRELAEQERRLQQVQRLQGQSQQMSAMRGQAIGLAAGGAAATYGAARFLAPGLELEQNMSKVQALTRLDKNSPQYKALEAQAKQLGATTAFTSADAASGQAFLAMAGFTPQSIRAAMPGMLDLALAGGIELDRTADIASNILSGMKLDPAKMGNVADVLSGAFTRSNTSIEMLGETMKYAAPGAAGLGVSIEQVAAMAGKLGDAGIQGSMGGTALRAIMLRLASPPKKAGDALSDLGIQVSDAEGNMRAMPDILADLYEKTKDLGNLERTSILSDISGVEAASAMAVLVDQAGNGALQTLIGDLQGAQGEASNLARTMADNTTGDFKGMTSAIDAFRTSIFEANREGIRNLIQNITQLTLSFTTFANANPGLMAVLGKIFGILAIGAVVIGGIGAVMLTILGPLALLKVSLITLGLPTTITPLAMISAGLTKIKTVLLGLRAAALFNPITLGIMAVAAAALFIYTYWEPIKAFFSGLWAGISDGLAPLKTLLTDVLEPVSSVLAPIKPIIDTIIGTLSMMGTQINFSSDTLIKFQAAGSALGYAIGTVLRYLIASMAGFVSALVIGFRVVGTALGNTVGFMVVQGGRLISWFSSLPSRLMAFLMSLPARMATMGGQIMEGLKNGILGKAQAVIGAITGIASRIKNAFTSARGMDIHSPSRVFTKYGGFMMGGLGGGILDNARLPMIALNNIARRIRKSAPGQMVESILGGISDGEPMQIDTRKSILPQRMGGGGMAMAGGMSTGNITININGATDPTAIAREVQRVLESRERNQMARQRSRLIDID